MKRFIRGILVALTLVSLSTSGVSAAQNGGIGGRPANPDPDKPRTQSIFIFSLDHGQSKSDQVLVSNNSETTKRIKIYPVDGVVTNTGAYTCRQASEALQDLGAWIQIDSTLVTLEPGQTEKVNFTVSVPQNADVGEHNGCIAFEDADDVGVAQGAVRVHTRQAIRVVETVPGDLHRQVDISSFTASTNSKSQHYDLALENKGNVSADVDTKVTVKNIFGQTVSSNGGSYPVLANQKLQLPFETTVTPFFGGWYQVQATISYNKAAGTFGLETDKNELVSKQSGVQVVFIAPSPLGALCLIVLALIVVGLFAWVVYRRRQKNEALHTWGDYTVQPGDTLESLATPTGLGWKRLARLNSIKAPYTLTPGQEIRLPQTNNTSELSVDETTNSKK